MLQLTGLTYAAHGRLARERGFPPRWETMEELSAAANAWATDVLALRARLARERGAGQAAREAVDRLVRTDAREHMDDPEFPEAAKLRMVRALHGMNRTLLSYHRYVGMLAPLVMECAERTGRETRLLELASGSGELGLALAALARKRRLPLRVTGSDYIPGYVEAGNRKAARRGLDVTFREINAFAMDAVPDGAYDVVFISQSMHHFTPGQLAVMIAQARRVATTAFVGIDGARGLLLLGALPLLAAVPLRPAFVHDAFVTARKLHTRAELDIVARIAAPGCRSWCTYQFPGVNSVWVRFDGAQAPAAAA